MYLNAYKSFPTRCSGIFEERGHSTLYVLVILSSIIPDETSYLQCRRFTWFDSPKTDFITISITDFFYKFHHINDICFFINQKIYTFIVLMDGISIMLIAVFSWRKGSCFFKDLNKMALTCK